MPTKKMTTIQRKMAGPGKERSMPISGTPRSLAEMDFVAGTHVCVRCGDQRPLRWKNGGSGSVWRTHATCPSCGTDRSYAFDCDDDLTEIEPPDLELGPGTSSVLSPGDLVRELARLGPEPAGDWDRWERQLTALNELAKFIPAGAAAVPAARQDAAAGPEEHYSRAWVDGERARLRALRRPTTAVPAVSEAPRGALDRAAQQAHHEWQRRGRSGNGRLDVLGVEARGGRFDGCDASGGRLERVDLREASLDLANWSDVELVRCDLTRSRINSTKFDGATILDTQLDGCGGALVSFARTKISGATFVAANLDDGIWTRAELTASSFERTVFGGARWDGASIQRCSFRGARFVPKRAQPPLSMRGAVFVDCDFNGAELTGADLRGARFERCMLAGVHGRSAHVEGVAVLECDLTLDELMAKLEPVISVEELARRKDDLVVGVDQDRIERVVVFEVPKAGDVGARAIGVIPAAQLDRVRGEGVRVGATSGAHGVVWLADDTTFHIWPPGPMRVEVTREHLLRSGLQTSSGDITGVVEWRDPERRGKRLVAVTTKQSAPSRIPLAIEEDFAANTDPAYTVEQSREDNVACPRSGNLACSTVRRAAVNIHENGMVGVGPDLKVRMAMCPAGRGHGMLRKEIGV